MVVFLIGIELIVVKARAKIYKLRVDEVHRRYYHCCCRRRRRVSRHLLATCLSIVDHPRRS